MKKGLLILVSVAMAIFSAGFVYAEKDSLFSFDTSASFYSQYVGGLGGAVFYEGFVIQPSFTASHNPSGLYVNLWGSYSPQGGFDSDYGDEVDYIAGINYDVGPVNIDVYYAYYNCYKLSEHNDGDVHAIGTILTFPEVWKLEPFITAEYNFVRGVSEENGLMYQVGANISLVENLSLGVSVGGHSEIYGTRTEVASYARCSLSYEINLMEDLVLTPELNFQKRVGYSESNGGLTKSLAWGGATLAYSF